MYRQYDIPIKASWLPMFAEMIVGDVVTCDVKDRAKIAVAISNGFHSTGKARFKTYKSKTDKSVLFVERVK